MDSTPTPTATPSSNQQCKQKTGLKDCIIDENDAVSLFYIYYPTVNSLVRNWPHWNVFSGPFMASSLSDLCLNLTPGAVTSAPLPLHLSVLNLSSV